MDDLKQVTVEIVSAYVSHNSLPVSEIAGLITSVHAKLGELRSGRAAMVPEAPPIPAVPIKKSVARDAIICLEDGKKFKSLRRHLSSAYQMTPDQYRAKWGLPSDYPMVAPGYAATRSELAKLSGLGRKMPVEVIETVEEMAVDEAEAQDVREAASAAGEEKATPKKCGRPRNVRTDRRTVAKAAELSLMEWRSSERGEDDARVSRSVFDRQAALRRS